MLSEVRKREHYEKPSVRKKLKSEAAKKKIQIEFLKKVLVVSLKERLQED